MSVEKVRMKIVVVCLGLLMACTKPNPNRCCTDEADCAANSIPLGSTCDDGLLCRGHQCIAIPCASASACDEAAPYCVAEACSEQCSDDTQCPGFGQSTNFCVAGACVACRDNADCSGAAPVCASGMCTACAVHTDCASGACKTDGTCADESEIAYVETIGSASSDCTRTSPCNSVARATAVTPTRSFLLFGSGTYTSAAAITFVGERTLIGTGVTPPTFVRSTPGPVFSLLGTVIARFERLEIAGATGAEGFGVLCGVSGSAPLLHFEEVTVRGNEVHGISAQGCDITAHRSRFIQNGIWGLNLVDGNGTIDRCYVAENGMGINLDAGLFSLTNTFIVRNYHATQFTYGLYVYSPSPGNIIEFNTIADNNDGSGTNFGAGFSCQVDSGIPSFPNNIVVRNKIQVYGSTCSHPGSIIRDTDIGALNFKSPDAAPYDYHIQAGSLAIDMAAASTLEHDFDGDARPQGAQRDVGADEFTP